MIIIKSDETVVSMKVHLLLIKAVQDEAGGGGRVGTGTKIQSHTTVNRQPLVAIEVGWSHPLLPSISSTERWKVIKN